MQHTDESPNERRHSKTNKGEASVSSADAAAVIDSEPNAAERNLADIDFARYCLATFVLCFARCVILHPLYVVVTRKQACCISGKQSIRQIVRSMGQSEGGVVASLCQGMVAVVLGMSFSETAHNAIYEFVRYQLEMSASLSLGSAAAGGAWSADFLARTIYCPFSVVAMRQMMHNSPTQAAERATASATAAAAAAAAAAVSTGTAVKIENTKLRHIVPRLYQHGGIRSFYAGFSLILIVGGFTSSVFFATYVNLKKLLYGMFTPYLERKEAEMKRTGSANGHPSWLYNSKDNLILNSTASVCGSCLASVILNPYYVVLTRRQSGVAASVREAVTTVYRQHGWRGFYRGAIASSALTIFDTLMASTTYEASMNFSMKRK